MTIGQDGKNYPASSPTPPESSDSEPITTTIAEPVEPDVVAPPRTPKRRSIVDTAVDLGHDLRKVSDRVVKITATTGWTRIGTGWEDSCATTSAR